MKINNYGSIKEANIKMFKNPDKIELIFGLSGSGKSTIVDALLGVDKNSLIFEEESKVEILNSELKQKIENINYIRFDENSAVKVVENQHNCFDLLGFSNQSAIEISLKELLDKINEIKHWFNDNEALFNTCDTIVKNLYKDDDKTSVKKINEQISKINDMLPENHRDGFKNGYNVITWMKDGNAIHEGKDTCLFCNSEVDRIRKEEISNIISSTFVQGQFKKLSNVSSIRNLPFPSENLFDEQKLLQEVIKAKKFSLLKDKIKTIIFLDFAMLIGTNEIGNFKFDISLLEINKLLEEYNEIIDKVIIENQQNINYFNEIIYKNKNNINDLLTKMNFQYKIDFHVNSSENSAKYFLQHKSNENSSIEDSKQLSYGERNLLALVITIAGSKENQLLILDDPMSSFDDMKRKEIIKKILKYKVDRNLDVIILTHDEYFVKQIIFEEEVAIHYNVRLIYRDNNNKIISQKLKQKHFHNIYSFDNIKHKFPIYLKLIKLRQIIEIKRKHSNELKPLYDRLTEIIKLTNTQKICNLSEYLLEKINTEQEKELSDVIKEHFEKVVICANNIDINLEHFTEIETLDKLLIMRFLTYEGEYVYTNAQYYYFMNELVHLFTSPIKNFDSATMAKLLNIENIEISEYVKKA